MASFLAYAISNNVGFAMLSGASVRYRFYTRWGVTADELSRIVFSYSVTFWLGLLALGGLSLVVSPLPDGARASRSRAARPGRLAPHARAAPLPSLDDACGGRRSASERFVLPMPSSAIAIGQVLISAVDWALAGAVLYVLLPAEPTDVSRLPRDLPRGDSAGHGQSRARRRRRVRGTDGDAPQAVSARRASCCRRWWSSGPSTICFPSRSGFLAWSPTRCGSGERTSCARAPPSAASTEQLTPTVLAAATFVAGVVLLFSGATPAAPGRLALARSRAAARRDRSVALSRQCPGRRAADPVARPGASSRRGVLPDGCRDRRRHGHLAPEGIRFRGSDAPVRGLAGAVAGATGVRSEGRILRHEILIRVGGGACRRAWRVRVAGAVCVQARGLLRRALVAVRASWRGLAVSSRHRRRRGGAAALWFCPADRLRATRGAACPPMPTSTTRGAPLRRSP